MSHQALDRDVALADPRTAASAAAGAEAARRAIAAAQASGASATAARARGWLCVHLFRQGQFEAMRGEAALALPELEAQPALQPDLFEVLRVLTLVHCETGRFVEALEAALRLGRLAAEAADADQQLLAACALGGLFDRIGDPTRGARILADTLAICEPQASARSRLIASIGLCAFHGDSFHRLRDAVPLEERTAALAEARHWGERAMELLPLASDPLMETAVFGNLGEIALHEARLDLAQSLLEKAIDRAAAATLVAHGWRGRASWCLWLLAVGRAAEARTAAETLLSEMGERAPLHTRIRALDAAQQACTALGDFQAALEHFREFERLERRRTISELRAHGQLFVSRFEAEGVHRQVVQARLEVEAARHGAEHDPLTGLGNRRLLQRRFDEIEPQGRARCALAMMDIDHFKSINDRFGHAAGDATLVALASMLREGTRLHDTVVRLGGEEFVVLFTELSFEVALEVCERLRQKVESHRGWVQLPPGQAITVSFGLTALADEGLQSALARADAHLYAAKRSGRNRVCAASGDAAAG